MRHGPHQVAQKFSSTTFPRAAARFTVLSIHALDRKLRRRIWIPNEPNHGFFVLLLAPSPRRMFARERHARRPGCQQREKNTAASAILRNFNLDFRENCLPS